MWQLAGLVEELVSPDMGLMQFASLPSALPQAVVRSPCCLLPACHLPRWPSGVAACLPANLLTLDTPRAHFYSNPFPASFLLVSCLIWERTDIYQTTMTSHLFLGIRCVCAFGILASWGENANSTKFGTAPRFGREEGRREGQSDRRPETLLYVLFSADATPSTPSGR